MMAGMTLKSLILAGLASGALAGCELGTGGTKVATGPGDGTIASATSTRLVDHDVEAPKVFQTTDKGDWVGRALAGGGRTWRAVRSKWLWGGPARGGRWGALVVRRRRDSRRGAGVL